jgi:hypothetical protein
MKYPRTAAGYREYLKSDHWDSMRTVVLVRDENKCVRCGGFGWQVHHKFYREDWETAQPSDCETLCRSCHEKQHPDKVQPDSERQKVHLGCPYSTFKELAHARSGLKISREDYLKWVGPLSESRKRARAMAKINRRKGKARWAGSKGRSKAARADYRYRVMRHWSF